MNSFMKSLLVVGGVAVAVAGACAISYKLFKKHCTIHIDFNPSEENSRACECDEEHCEVCNPPSDEAIVSE